MATPKKKTETENKLDPKKKVTAKKKAASKKKAVTKKKVPVKKKAVPKKKAAPKKKIAVKKKVAPKKKVAVKKKAVPKKKAATKRKIDPNIVQRQASDPTQSVWVSASAGTGKTKVLTDRVLRLLLSGSKPENILCMTFTNAAASVMKTRIREVLSEWSTCSDRVLETKLKNMTGKKPDLKMRKRARQLLAEFLEAPGGMKIQTIHSFSQSLLRRFPIESGIPPYFNVLDDQTASELMRDAQAEVLNEVQKNPNTLLSQSVKMITPEVSEEDFIALIGEISYRRSELNKIFKNHGGIENTIKAVYDYVEAPQDLTARKIRKQICSETGYNGNRPDLTGLKEAATLLSTGSASDQEKSAMIREWLEYPEDRMDMYLDYIRVFLTSTDEPRKRMATKKCEEALPALEAEASRLLTGMEDIKTANVARGTESLLIFANAILEKYEERKKALNLLDYDDLIHGANDLLADQDTTSWVLRKLDGNLEHILVDEAQDTNPDQWKIVASIIHEFFHGADKPKGKKKTMFVVGDEKQSIFSFQRADPKIFNERRKYFEKEVTKAGGKWKSVDMGVTFRSSPAIMTAVDAVFANKKASDGLFFDDDIEVTHDAFRQGQSGTVEIHPVITHKAPMPIEPWSLPLETTEEEDPAIEMAEKIADQVKEWLDSGEKLKARGRPISPADIMILVRRRSAFVDHVVRALKKRDVPVAGADRMSLREQIVVMDLVALAEFSLMPDDDFKLATVLKSPLVGLNDQELEDITLGRKGTLWEALEQKANKEKNEHSPYTKAYVYLSQMKEDALTKRPYDFYFQALMNDCPANEKSGIFALYSRLGFDAEDPLVEFMNAVERFEQSHSPILQGFLSWLEAGQAEVKREMSMDANNPKVHIMTIHGAKGLEAPIVFLADTTTIPSDNTRTRPKLLWPDGDRVVPLWVPRSDLENKKFIAERQKAEIERDREYRRLLYVALTRAADRLYVHGYQNKKNRSSECWYDLIKDGITENLKNDISLLDKDAKETTTEDEENIIQFHVPQTARAKNDGMKPVKKARRVGVPAWARNMPQSPGAPVKTFRPSDAGQKSSNDNQIKKSVNVPSPLTQFNEHAGKKIGTIVHGLLEFIPNLPEKERKSATAAYLAKPGFGLYKKTQDDLSKQVLSVINNPEFAGLFGKNSRPEVNITGMIEQNGEKKKLSGQIDRLVITEKEVLIVDYKSNLKIPKTDEDIPDMYVTQMAAYRQALKEIYPDKKIKCLLLWTRESKMQEVPEKMMNKAVQVINITSANYEGPKRPKR